MLETDGGREPLYHRPQFLAHRATGVAVLEDLQKVSALMVRTQKQPLQGMHRGQRQARIGIGPMCAGNFDDAHHRAGIAGGDACGGSLPPASRRAPHRSPARPLFGHVERRPAARADPHRVRPRFQSNRISAHAGKPKKFATYTPMQVERVLRAIREDRNRHAWHLALSGLRRGEIGGLRWTNIDFKAKTLTIGPTRISVDGKAVEQDGAKSEDSHRVLPIPDPLLVELKVAKNRQASEKLTLGTAYADLGYVVCNEAGQPYHPTRCPKCGPRPSARPGCLASGCTTLGIPAAPRCICRASRPR